MLAAVASCTHQPAAVSAVSSVLRAASSGFMTDGTPFIMSHASFANPAGYTACGKAHAVRPGIGRARQWHNQARVVVSVPGMPIDTV
jgi:hypothetical protein